MGINPDGLRENSVGYRVTWEKSPQTLILLKVEHRIIVPHPLLASLKEKGKMPV